MVVRVVHGSGKVSLLPPHGNPALTKAQIAEKDVTEEQNLQQIHHEATRSPLPSPNSIYTGAGET
ncbi:MAG: hypothetical protein OSB29_06600 [Verrucomicrobiota bacterium]|nr:hypothetical protein [Verrucomicrobiota bacterium]